jgi:hypothetical protein
MRKCQALDARYDSSFLFVINRKLLGRRNEKLINSVPGTRY